MSDAIRKLIEQQEAMRRLTDPFHGISDKLNSLNSLGKQAEAVVESLRLFEANQEHRNLISSFHESPAGKMMRDMEQHRKLVVGPLDQARLGILSSGISAGRLLSAEHDRYEKLFHLPAIADINRLAVEAISAHTTSSGFWAASGRLNDIETAMGAMTSPWLNMDHELQSARAFGNLVGIGRGIATLAPYEAALVENLRPGLGDWRDPITMLEVWKDPIPRSDFYFERGFDPELTEFTREAFEETVEIAGLAFSSSTVGDEDADELRRSREAFARLQELERAIRRFIVRVMEATFGVEWMKRQLPPGMLDGWTAKRNKAVLDGQAADPLIDYADFTEYKLIIERKDNWSNAFKSVFGRSEDIRESFQRMFPLRVATMHGRIITVDDELLLMVETRRILQAIKKQG